MLKWDHIRQCFFRRGWVLHITMQQLGDLHWRTGWVFLLLFGWLHWHILWDWWGSLRFSVPWTISRWHRIQDSWGKIRINASDYIFVSDVNECVSAPCQHNGTCQDQINGYSCLCMAGYTGTQCETGLLSWLYDHQMFQLPEFMHHISDFCVFLSDIDECASSPCENNATCLQDIDFFNCTCVAGFTGTHCETSKTSSFQFFRIRSSTFFSVQNVHRCLLSTSRVPSFWHIPALDDNEVSCFIFSPSFFFLQIWMNVHLRPAITLQRARMELMDTRVCVPRDTQDCTVRQVGIHRFVPGSTSGKDRVPLNFVLLPKPLTYFWGCQYIRCRIVGTASKEIVFCGAFLFQKLMNALEFSVSTMALALMSWIPTLVRAWMDTLACTVKQANKLDFSFLSFTFLLSPYGSTADFSFRKGCAKVLRSNVLAKKSFWQLMLFRLSFVHFLQAAKFWKIASPFQILMNALHHRAIIQRLAMTRLMDTIALVSQVSRVFTVRQVSEDSLLLFPAEPSYLCSFCNILIRKSVFNALEVESNLWPFSFHDSQPTDALFQTSMNASHRRVNILVLALMWWMPSSATVQQDTLV